MQRVTMVVRSEASTIEEPDAGKLYLRICAGGAGNGRPYRERYQQQGAPMYCPECGAQLTNNSNFCSNCGHAVKTIIAPTDHISVAPLQEAPVCRGVAASSLGTKWLRFWNYFSLPVGGALGLLISIRVPELAIIFIPISLLQLVVAYGLHHRILWAWKWNWVLLIITCMSMALPTPTPGIHSSEADLVVQFITKAVLGGLIWMWPNYVYWKKRRDLFFSYRVKPSTNQMALCSAELESASKSYPHEASKKESQISRSASSGQFKNKPTDHTEEDKEDVEVSAVEVILVVVPVAIVIVILLFVFGEH